MPLSVSFTFETNTVRHGSPSVRFLPSGVLEIWRERAFYPKLEVWHTTADNAVECVGSNYLLWSVVYDSGEPFKRCKRCPDTHTLGWKRKQPPMRIIEYGEEVDGFIPMGSDAPPGVVTHTNNKYYHPDTHRAAKSAQASADLAPHETYPVVRYRDLNADGSRQFKAFLSCNSHFHGHHLFHIKVQFVELNARGDIIRVEVAYSPRIKVVSKFLNKKGTKAIPVADVRRFLSMQSLRKRRKLANLSAIAGTGELELPAFPTADPDSRRRKIPADMTELAAQQDAMLAATQATGSSPFPPEWSQPGSGMTDMDIGAASASASSASSSATSALPPSGLPRQPSVQEQALAAHAAYTGQLPAATGSQLPTAVQPGSDGQLPSATSVLASSRTLNPAALSSLALPLGLTSMDVASPINYAKGLSPASTALFADPLLSSLGEPTDPSGGLDADPLFSSLGLSSFGEGEDLLAEVLASRTASRTAPPPPSTGLQALSPQDLVNSFQMLSVPERKQVLRAIASDATSWQLLKAFVLDFTAQNANMDYNSE
ncbi:uncharacterized protein AMSG_03588 [Thecamonas trahens ATCC 50062]|uniref:Uncharacterized protein n=1 Tax=Thecamonas trahens ATCC 50062 TaxID=461836 RepID=A0A0L0D4J8_THETB|nr:hypothetical protein AMSG_03588 [Thecamonas trahens ATCC 50062]KNC47160.1 hypothetical protein AMSG_03588 [Thecamonas trahens ATCC 50062]|eukprot:XP_013759934.1 hypothetical protein AMSG_03588 [Thecamonas trahens ATCC 50062]